MKGEWMLKGCFYNKFGVEFVVTKYNLPYRKLFRTIKAMYRAGAFKVETTKTGGRK